MELYWMDIIEPACFANPARTSMGFVETRS
jgi:hypothetical protein